MAPGFHTYHRLVRDPVQSHHDGEPVHLCDACGAERHPGDWPHCPHGKGTFGEEPLEPYFDEHVSEEGAWITSRAQRRAIMAKGGLDYRKKDPYLIPGRRAFVFYGGK